MNAAEIAQVYGYRLRLLTNVDSLAAGVDVCECKGKMLPAKEHLINV